MSGATSTHILGYKVLAMVERYAHLSEEPSLAVADRMAERFLGANQGEDGGRSNI